LLGKADDCGGEGHRVGPQISVNGDFVNREDDSANFRDS
jgi:hypothetical protein